MLGKCKILYRVLSRLKVKSLPSWYDEHPDIPLNQARGGMRDGSLEAYWIADSGFDWEGVAMGVTLLDIV